MLYLLILYSFLVVRKTAFQCFKTAFYFFKTPFCFCLILKPLFQSKKSLPQLHTLVRPFYASINLKSKNEVGELQKAIRLPPIKFCFLWFA